MNSPGCLYIGRPFAFYTTSLNGAGDGKVTNEEVMQFMDLVGATPAAHAQGGFAWPGDRATCAKWYAMMEDRAPTEDEYASYQHHIRNYDGIYQRGGIVVTCSTFTCKFGTPLRKLVDLMHLFESKGYRVLGTYDFMVDIQGRVRVIEGEHPRVMAYVLRSEQKLRMQKMSIVN